MFKFLGGRGASAAAAFFLIAMGSSVAAAQPVTPVAQAATTVQAPTAVTAPTTTATSAVATVSGSVIQAAPASSVTVSLAPAIAKEAAWLYQNGWPLYALADRYSTGAPLDEQGNCLATAVYFEARGESVEGQLAVARVVINRAVSLRYPPDICGVVKQPAQFSFVRRGEFPAIDTGSTAWARAQGIARLAMANVIPSVGNDVLWYHATYVAPSWGRRLNFVEKIGQHIFYRA